MSHKNLKDLNLEILQGMVSDVESVRDCTKTLKLVTLNLKAATKFLKSPDLPPSKENYWETVQLFSISMLNELVPIVKGLINETVADARYGDYLALAETMSQITIYLEKEEISEPEEKITLENLNLSSNQLELLSTEL